MSLSKGPGPGTYKMSNGISANGKYFVSTIPSVKGFGFGRGTRLLSSSASFSRLDTPGPGCYRAQTEFGYIENPREDNMSKTIGSFKEKKGSKHGLRRNMSKL